MSLKTSTHDARMSFIGEWMLRMSLKTSTRDARLPSLNDGSQHLGPVAPLRRPRRSPSRRSLGGRAPGSPRPSARCGVPGRRGRRGSRFPSPLPARELDVLGGSHPFAVVVKKTRGFNELHVARSRRRKPRSQKDAWFQRVARGVQSPLRRRRQKDAWFQRVARGVQSSSSKRRVVSTSLFAPYISGAKVGAGIEGGGPTVKHVWFQRVAARVTEPAPKTFSVAGYV